MNRILYGSNQSIENLISEYVKGSRITFDEFSRICKNLISTLSDFELKTIFNEMDKRNRKELDKNEFSLMFSKL